jgi:hypothetical protein
MVTTDSQLCVRTLRLKVKREGYAWLNAAAIEVNQVWNFANAASYKAARPFAGQPRWCPSSVCGNEPPLIVAPPSQTSSRCEASTCALKAAA